MKEGDLFEYKNSTFKVLSVDYVVDATKVGEKYHIFNPGLTAVTAERILKEGVPEIIKRVELYCTHGAWSGFLYLNDNRFVVCDYNGAAYYYISEETFDMSMVKLK